MDYVSFAYINLRLVAGVFDLEDVSDFNVNTNANRSMVKTMTRQRVARGKITGIQDVSIDMTVAMRFPNTEIPWERLLRSGERFTLSWQREEGGEKRQVTGVTVDEVAESVSAEGSEGTLKLTLTGFENRADPT